MNKDMCDIITYVSKKHRAALDEHKERTGLPLSRLVAIALDNELMKEVPFDFSLELPDDLIDLAFAEQAGMIADFFKRTGKPYSLDMLYVLRGDIGIDNPEEFLAGFAELLRSKMIKPYKGKRRTNEGITYYAIDSNYGKSAKEAREYAKFIRLQKKFGKKAENL